MAEAWLTCRRGRHGRRSPKREVQLSKVFESRSAFGLGFVGSRGLLRQFLGKDRDQLALRGKGLGDDWISLAGSENPSQHGPSVYSRATTFCNQR